MKVVSYVYNAFSRLARGIITVIKTKEIQIACAMVAVSVGFTLLVFASSGHETSNWVAFLIAGAIAVIGGILIAIPAYKAIEIEEKAEKRREEERHREFLKALKDLPSEIDKAIKGRN